MGRTSTYRPEFADIARNLPTPSLADLSRTFNVSQSTISAWLNRFAEFREAIGTEMLEKLENRKRHPKSIIREYKRVIRESESFPEYAAYALERGFSIRHMRRSNFRNKYYVIHNFSLKKLGEDLTLAEAKEVIRHARRESLPAETISQETITELIRIGTGADIEIGAESEVGAEVESEVEIEVEADPDLDSDPDLVPVDVDVPADVAVSESVSL